MSSEQRGQGGGNWVTQGAGAGAGGVMNSTGSGSTVNV